MIDKFEIEKLLKDRGPTWSSTITPSGLATWVDIEIIGGYIFTIQVTPSEGIGVTDRSGRLEEVDFGGHEEVFSEFTQVLDYIEKKIGDD